MRQFGGALVDGAFLVNPQAPVEIVQYQTGRTAIWQSGGLVAAFGPDQVLSLGYETRQGFRRETPGWAIVLGVLGLLFFLIGVVFFFVKVNVPVYTRVLTLRLVDGRHLTITQP